MLSLSRGLLKARAMPPSSQSIIELQLRAAALANFTKKLSLAGV